MDNLLNSLGDGWTIYLWLVVGAMIIVASIYGILWAWHNEQFDEDIKYVVFNDEDRDKMKPEEFAKAQEVMKKQMESRQRHLAMQAARKKSA